MSSTPLPKQAITLEEHDERMKTRTRPVTQDPIQLRTVISDHQLVQPAQTPL